MKRVLTAAIMLAAMCPEIVFADDYPSKPIHVLTTSSAGGISDIFMRVLGEEPVSYTHLTLPTNREV